RQSRVRGDARWRPGDDDRADGNGESWRGTPDRTRVEPRLRGAQASGQPPGRRSLDRREPRFGLTPGVLAGGKSFANAMGFGVAAGDFLPDMLAFVKQCV